jgi:hypothetical protein
MTLQKIGQQWLHDPEKITSRPSRWWLHDPANQVAAWAAKICFQVAASACKPAGDPLRRE